MPGFPDIVGQDAVLAALQRAYAGKRRPHAYIFAGPEGVGRRTTATEFARLLLCQAPTAAGGGETGAAKPGPAADVPIALPCGRCASCRTLDAGTNPDFQLVYKELARFSDDEDVRERKMQELGIEVVRQFLIAPAYRAAVGGRGKVFVVQGADLMSAPAQNALLKTLEEPPPGVSIILLAVTPEDLLPTTRSRCQIVRFQPLSPELVADRLARQGVAPEEARFWAALTGGSLGRASRLARENLYEFKRELADQLAGAGPVPLAGLAEMLVKATDRLSKRFTGRDELLAASLANRQAGEIILQLLAGMYRDALTVACSARRPLANADQPDAVRRLAARFDPASLAEILTQLGRYEQLLWRNVNAKLLWDNVAITCASAEPLAAE